MASVIWLLEFLKRSSILIMPRLTVRDVDEIESGNIYFL